MADGDDQQQPWLQMALVICLAATAFACAAEQAPITQVAILPE